jgi:hypothetical protein
LVLPLLPTWAQEPRTKDEIRKIIAGKDQKRDEQRVIVVQGDDGKPGQIIVRVADDKDAVVKMAPQGLEEAKDEVELLHAQLDVKRAELAEGEARVKQAAQRWERIKSMAAKGVISEGELANMQGDVELAKAQLEPKRAQLREAEIRLSHAKRRLARLEQTGKQALPMKGAKGNAQVPQARQKEELLKERKRLEDVLKSLADEKMSAETKAKVLDKLRAERDVKLQTEKARAEAEAAKAGAKDALKEAAKLRDQLMKSGKMADVEALRKKLIAQEQLRADEALLQAKKAEEAAAEAKRQFQLRGKVVDPANPKAAGKSTTDPQLQELQKKVDALTREMEELRKELRALVKPKSDAGKPDKKSLEFKVVPAPGKGGKVESYQLVPIPDKEGKRVFELKVDPIPRSDPRSVPTVPLTPKKDDKPS